MQVGQFPASAANSLIEGYCDDFVSLAATLAQTLEQVAMRGIAFDASRPALERIEHGMRELADAIQELLARGSVSNGFETVLGRKQDQGATAAPPAPEAPRPTAARPTRPLGDGGHTPSAGAPRPHGTRPQQQQQRPTPSAPAQPAQPPQPPPAPRSIAASSAARTTRPASAAANTPRPARTETLKGTNRSMPLLSVFQFLGRMRKSGTVHVYIQDETLAFEFVNGCIEFTASDRCPVGERLGELLVELGSCTREALAPILAKVGVSSAHRLGHLVVESKLVSNGQVLEALESQVKRRFQRVCTCADAAYEFDEGRRLPGDGRIRIAPFELSFEPGRGDRHR
jgi:hypothetical protein